MNHLLRPETSVRPEAELVMQGGCRHLYQTLPFRRGLSFRLIPA